MVFHPRSISKARGRVLESVGNGEGKEMRRLLALIACVAFVMTAFVGLSQPATAQGRVGAFMDELFFFEQPNIDQALPEVSAGTNMQLYMFNLKSVQAIEKALADPNLNKVITPGSVDDLYINPVPHGAGVPGFNPFQIREVREAMHWLIDRDFIVEQVFGGHAVPFLSPPHPLQPEYLRQIVFFQNLDRQYTYQPQKARETIFAALEQVPGMTFGADGKWSYQGSLLTVTIIIRTEDRRFDIGNYIADQVEGLGITVKRDYEPGPVAFRIVYFGDPTIGAWHLYTEGFGYTALDAWPDNYLAGFFTASAGEAVFDSYKPDATEADVMRRLELSLYSDVEERASLIRRGSELAMRDPVRLFLVAEQAVFISNKAITGYVYDLSGGPWTVFTTRSARYATPGGQLRIGQPLHFNSQWNTYRGFTWLYDTVQARSFIDNGMYYDPHRGTWIPIRTTPTVTTSGGYTKPPLVVPRDALWFNVSSMQFESVAQGLPITKNVTAVSKITYDYTFGKWHHGIDMSMDDVWYILANYFRRFQPAFWGDLTNRITGKLYAAGDLGQHDKRAASFSVVTFLSFFKGAKQIDADTLEIYVDFWHPDNGLIASLASTDLAWPSDPWECHETAVKTVLDDQTRFHATTARVQGKVLLDMIRGASLPLLDGALATLKAANEIPAGFSTIITAAEASARWAALEAWKNRDPDGTGPLRGHYAVSNGPFFLDRVDPVNKQTTFKRFLDYPLPADKWDYLLVPKVATVSIGTIPEVVPGFDVTIPVTTTLGGQPYDQLSLDYLIVNPATGTVLFSGKPTRTAAGSWKVVLNASQTAQLVPGAYDAQLIGVGADAAVPISAKKTFIAIPQLTVFERLIRSAEATLGGQINTVQNNQDTANKNTLAALDRVTGLLFATIAIAVLAVVVSGVSIALLLRRGAKPKAPPETGESM